MGSLCTCYSKQENSIGPCFNKNLEIRTRPTWGNQENIPKGPKERNFTEKWMYSERQIRQRRKKKERIWEKKLSSTVVLLLCIHAEKESKKEKRFHHKHKKKQTQGDNKRRRRRWWGDVVGLTMEPTSANFHFCNCRALHFAFIFLYFS